METHCQKKLQKNNHLPVGKIVGSFGYKGELKIIPYDSWPKDASLNKVYIEFDANFKKYSIESSRKHNKFYLLLLKNIDLDQSKILINKVLWLKREKIDPLDEGEYYVQDLLGLKVYDQNANFIGILKEIIKMAAGHDIFLVKNDTNEYLLPALNKFISNICLSTGRITVKMDELYE